MGDKIDRVLRLQNLGSSEARTGCSSSVNRVLRDTNRALRDGDRRCRDTNRVCGANPRPGDPAGGTLCPSTAHPHGRRAQRRARERAEPPRAAGRLCDRGEDGEHAYLPGASTRHTRVRVGQSGDHVGRPARWGVVSRRALPAQRAPSCRGRPRSRCGDARRRAHTRPRRCIEAQRAGQRAAS